MHVVRYYDLVILTSFLSTWFAFSWFFFALHGASCTISLWRYPVHVGGFCNLCILKKISQDKADHPFKMWQPFSSMAAHGRCMSTKHGISCYVIQHFTVYNWRSIANILLISFEKLCKYLPVGLCFHMLWHQIGFEQVDNYNVWGLTSVEQVEKHTHYQCKFLTGVGGAPKESSDAAARHQLTALWRWAVWFPGSQRQIPDVFLPVPQFKKDHPHRASASEGGK